MTVCIFSPPCSSILVTISSRLQHETWCIFHEGSIQTTISPRRGLNCANPLGEPNVNHRHASPDLPPHTKPFLTERVTLCPSLLSIIFVPKLSIEKVCAIRSVDVFFWISASSSDRYVSYVGVFLNYFPSCILLNSFYLLDILPASKVSWSERDTVARRHRRRDPDPGVVNIRLASEPCP